jgi:hypothetical protein
MYVYIKRKMPWCKLAVVDGLGYLPSTRHWNCPKLCDAEKEQLFNSLYP